MTIGDDDDSNLLLSLSLKQVNYSCGSCGYQLNLNSCNRNTSVIGSEYEKSLKRGVISFLTIDESRFTKIEERKWTPYFNSIYSWGLLLRRTKLLCYNCGNHIGNAYKESTSSHRLSLGKSQSLTWDGISDSNKIYDIKIRALQPLSEEDCSVVTIFHF